MPTAASYANIALGLIAQLIGEWWRRQHQLERLPSSFHILPLIYGVFSVLLRVNTFTEWTGLYSLGVALIPSPSGLVCIPWV